MKSHCFWSQDFSIMGLNLLATAQQSRCKAELGALQAVTSPEGWSQQEHKNHAASICARASPLTISGAGAGHRCCCSDAQGPADDHNVWQKANSKQLPRDVTLEKTVAWQVHMPLPVTRDGNTGTQAALR